MKRVLLAAGAGISIAVMSPLAVALAGAAVQETAAGSTAPNNAGGGSWGRLAVGTVPAQWQAAVQAAGTTCSNVSPALIAAQIQQESGWSRTALSPAGAVGLSQFMPATWAAEGLDANGDGTADPLDPLDAIGTQGRYDCRLAAELTGVTGNAQDNMLAAYNAGPGSVLAFGGVPPYAETRGYVRNIRALMVRYTDPAPPDRATSTIAASGCTLPLPGSSITQHFGATNVRDSDGHPGVDLSIGRTAEQVVAACAGTVAFAGPASGYGPNFVQILHPGGFVTTYGHMNSIFVAVGEQVAAGQAIGDEGWQGDVVPAGPGGIHLHFEVRLGVWGPVQNPETWLAARRVQLQ